MPEGEVDYGYLLDDDPVAKPDPRSRRQPAGVHERSRTFDPAAYAWSDGAWTGRQLAGSTIYELHVGTFTPEGTFDAALGKLDHLQADRRRPRRADAGQRRQRRAQLGLRRGAVVGGPRGVRRPGGVPALRRRLPRGRARRDPGRRPQPPRPVGQLPAAVRAVPEGRSLHLGRPASTSTATAAPRCAGCVLDNVRMWFEDFHVDGLRLDAVHALHDESPVHLLEEMAVEVAALSAHHRRPMTLIAESDLNDPRLVTPREAGGYGLDAQWSDDFHHAVHVALTGETDGYYADFAPLSALAKVMERGLLPRRHVVVVPRPQPRRADRRRPDARLAAGRLQPEPRPGRQPRPRRPAHRGARRRPARLRRDADALLALHADALPGRGVGGVVAVPVLHLAPGAGARARRRRGQDRGVRADGLGPRRRSRPAGPGDVRPLQPRLVRARHRPPRRRAGRLPPAGGAAAHAARAHRPRPAHGLVHGRRGTPAVHDAARRPCSSR